VSFGILAGLVLLLGGLWWVQVVCGREYQTHLETQSFRSIRTPAPRGKILDRNGIALADNRPRYDVSLYLEDMRKPFDAEFSQRKAAIVAALKAQRLAKEKSLGRELTKEELKPYRMSMAQINDLRRQSKLSVVNAFTADLAQKLQMPLVLDVKKFTNHASQTPYQPFPVVTDLQPQQIARFEEQFGGMPGVDLEMRTIRSYPLNTTAGHLLGYLKRENESRDGEEAYYSYRLPDYNGVVGLEEGFNDKLSGHAGGKSVLVNNLGYKQSENVWQPTVPGDNVVLTLDSRLQQAAEAALRNNGANTRGAVVVMNVNNGDILALASSPSYNPNHWITGFPPGEWERLNNDELKVQINRATYGAYQPGSIFKIIVGIAALESGLNPNAIYTVPPHPTLAGKGIARFGRNQSKVDLAPPGQYNFRRAFAKSSNGYFIDCGLDAGVEKIVALGRKLHLGERCDLPMSPESRGQFPALNQLSSGWSIGATANLCIGQEKVYMTPLQAAVVISAVANGGTVYWPRLVQRTEPQDPLSPAAPTEYPAGRVRDQLNLKASTLRVVHDAMLADTEDPDGTGRAASGVPGLRVGGKTGTAQVENARGNVVDHITWFASYAPWEKPRYAVVVMVESGSSGGGTCAPVAHDVYEAIRAMETQPTPIASSN
jgi:penicillin-binding protein 2